MSIGRPFTYRLPVYLALAGIVVGALADLACPLTASADSAPVRVTLNTHFGNAPLDIRVRILVTPHPDNRAVCVVVNGPLRETSSCFPHDNRNVSERTVSFVRLPEGEYAIWAVLLRADTKDGIMSAAATVNVQ